MISYGQQTINGEKHATLYMACNCCQRTIPVWGSVALDLVESAIQGLIVMAKHEGWERYYKQDGEAIDVCPECSTSNVKVFDIDS